jgi:outer membrane protein assembly factor BamB
LKRSARCTCVVADARSTVQGHDVKGRTALTIAALAAAFAPAPAFAASGDAWPMWQRGASHSGFVPATVSLDGLAFAWSRQAHDGAIVGLAASSTMVFTTESVEYYGGSPPVKLVAQDIASGDTVWSVTTDFGVTYGEPAYADGRLYVLRQTIPNNVADPPLLALDCLDAATGATIWSDPLATPAFYAGVYAPTIAGGVVYVLNLVAQDPTLLAFDAGNGATRWSVPIDALDTRAVTPANGLLYAMTDGLVTIDPADGATLGFIADPDHDSPSSGPRAPTLLGGSAYATSAAHFMSFDLAAGSVASSLAIHAGGQIATDGRELFMLSAGALSVRDPATGAVRWGFEAPQQGPVDPGILSDNIIVMRSHVILTDGVGLYMVSRTTRQLEVGFQIGGHIAYAGDTLLVADANGIVSAFALPSDEIFVDGFESD